MLRRGLVLLSLFGIASAIYGASYIVPPDSVLIGKAESIVIARPTAAWVENTTERGIETVTEFTVEDTLKGSVPHTFRIRMPGGHFGKVFKVIPGTPHFEIGAQQLLFINKRATIDYTTTDFGLGHFALEYDDAGQRIALRDDEIFGWDLKTHEVHREKLRAAEKFMDYIRAVANGGSGDPDYFVPDRPLRRNPNSNATPTALHPAPLSCTFPSTCTAVQYTLSFYSIGLAPCNSGVQATDDACAEAGPQGRWITFPSAVNWNRGNTETNAGNGGSDAINAAFAAWNGDTGSNVNYVLASTNSNLHGIVDAPDSVNNVVFEENLGSNFSCVSGGLLGEGGINSASGTHTFAGGTWFNNVEGDVSINQGVGACIGQSPGITVGDFNSAVTHEIGHTLSFRHSDRSRDNFQLCTFYSTYDCSSSAIMTAVVTSGLSATLTTWDQHAVRSIYPSSPYNPPTNVVATATSSTNIHITWNAPSGTAPGKYNIYRITNVATPPSTPTASVTYPTASFDDTVALSNSYLYRVRSADAGGANESVDSPESNLDFATTVSFTNLPATAGVTVIKKNDIDQLRLAIDKVRALGNTGAAFYSTDGTVTAGVTTVKVQHVTDMRTFVNVGRNNAGIASAAFTNALTANVTTIKALDFNEIRTATRSVGVP